MYLSLTFESLKNKLIVRNVQIRKEYKIMAPIAFNPMAITPCPTATKAPASTSPAGSSTVATTPVATTPVAATPDPLLTTQTDPATGRPVRTSDVVSTDNVANSNDTKGVSPETETRGYTDSDLAEANKNLDEELTKLSTQYLNQIDDGTKKEGSYYNVRVTGSYTIPSSGKVLKVTANITFHCTKTSVVVVQNGPLDITLN